MTPLTYTTKAVITAVNVSYPGSPYSSHERAAIEVELVPAAGESVSFKGTLGLDAALGEPSPWRANDLIGAAVEVTVGLTPNPLS